MSESGLTTYTVDVVFCIDITSSMTPYLLQLKKLALDFTRAFEEKLVREGKTIENLRARIVAFRDLGETGDAAIEATPFFVLPDQQDRFSAAINSLSARGGGSYPESSLEGLWVAMNSDWQTAGSRRRHIIVLATDDSAHPLGKFPYEMEQVPFATPKNLSELQKRWGIPGVEDQALMDKNARRLLIFAPDKQPWAEIGDTWERTTWFPSAAGSGLTGVELDVICNSLAASV